MKAEEIRCPQPKCKTKLRGAMQLNFHIRKEHSGAVDVHRAFVTAAYKRERAALRAERGDPDVVWSKLKGLYENCPCGRSLAQHRQVHDHLAKTGALA